MANNKNLASGTLVAGITTSSTTLTVYVGDGNSSTVQGVWPTAPFYATVMPSSPEAGVSNSLDSEIVQVTAVSSDQDNNTTLTVTRAQKNTTAKSFDAGAVVTNAIYTDEVAQASGTVGGPINPVYLNNGVITAANTQSSGNNYSIVPKVSSDGVMDIGRYIDLHNTASGATDYTTRIEANVDGNLYIQGGAYADVSVGTGISIRGAYTKIGDLSSLDTSAKNNLVAAINEVDGALDDAAYVGSVLSTPTSVDYVATDNIQDGAVTSNKIDFTTIKTLLFSGTDSGGSSGTIAFTDSPTNYKYLQVFFHDDQSYENSIFIKNNYASNTTFCLQSAKASINGTTIFLLSKRMQLNSTGIARGLETLITLVGGSTPTSSSSNVLRVTEVYGYK